MEDTEATLESNLREFQLTLLGTDAAESGGSIGKLQCNELINGSWNLLAFGRARRLVYVRPSNEALLRARVPGAHRPT